MAMNNGYSNITNTVTKVLSGGRHEVLEVRPNDSQLRTVYHLIENGRRVKILKSLTNACKWFTARADMRIATINFPALRPQH